MKPDSVFFYRYFPKKCNAFIAKIENTLYYKREGGIVMACYGQLLLLCGGGVIDHAKQVERQDEATLVIGLGGTGCCYEIEKRSVQTVKTG